MLSGISQCLGRGQYEGDLRLSISTGFPRWSMARDSAYRCRMKYAAARPFAAPEAAARKLVEIASGIEPIQDGRIFTELVNVPFLRQHKGTGDEFGAGIKFAVERGWLELHESGTFVRLTKAAAR